MTETNNINREFKFYSFERFKEECEKKAPNGVENWR